MREDRTQTRDLLDMRPTRRGKEKTRCYENPSSPSPEWSRSSALAPKRAIRLRRRLRRTPRRRHPRPRSPNPNRQSQRRRPRPLPRCPRQQRLPPARWRRRAPSPCPAPVMRRAGSRAATCNSKSARSPVPGRSTAPRARRATCPPVCVCRAQRRNKPERTDPACLPDEAVGYLLLRIAFAPSERRLTEYR